MITKNSTIFIIEDDKPYGALLQRHLKNLGFQNVVIFHDEEQCLNNMHQHPKVLISDYNLNYMSGLRLIEEAREKSTGFYSILLSGVYNQEHYAYDMSSHNIDKYIMKGDDELQKLSQTLDNFMNPTFSIHLY